jgi:hypothetical protein
LEQNCYIQIVIGEHCCNPYQDGRSALVISYIYRSKMRVSEKRSQIPILGLDSLLLQAYNPAPLFRNGKRIWPQSLLLEWLKNKVTKMRF